MFFLYLLSQGRSNTNTHVRKTNVESHLDLIKSLSYMDIYSRRVVRFVKIDKLKYCGVSNYFSRTVSRQQNFTQTW